MAAGPETPLPPRRPSRLRYLFLFVLGLLIGRIASESFPAGLLQAVDLLMWAGIAAVVALSWRAWARRVFEERRRQQLERQQRMRRARRKDE